MLKPEWACKEDDINRFVENLTKTWGNTPFEKVKELSLPSQSYGGYALEKLKEYGITPRSFIFERLQKMRESIDLKTLLIELHYLAHDTWYIIYNESLVGNCIIKEKDQRLVQKTMEDCYLKPVMKQAA